MESTEGVLIDLEVDVNISVLPYTNCYASLIESYDDRHDFIDMYELNELDNTDERLIRVVMSTDNCDNIGKNGIILNINNAKRRKLMGDKCNYVPYQLIKDCKDGDVVDYIIILPYHINILLHMTCKQIPIDQSEFSSKDTALLFTKFDTAVNRCKSDRRTI